LNIACPILDSKLSTVNSDPIVAPTGITYTFGYPSDGVNEVISVDDSSLKKDYIFYIKLFPKDINPEFTAKFTLSVVCNNLSTVVTIDTSLGPLGGGTAYEYVQYVDT
jgi:hypothetical protein